MAQELPFTRRLADKIAVVTGANSGISRSAARRFACEGACVFMVARRNVELDDAVREVGGDALGIVADISSLQIWMSSFFSIVREEAGSIDVLFANACGGGFELLADVTEAHYQRTFDTNVKGTLFTVQKALRCYATAVQ